jgi:hypothetical protein
VKRLNWVLICAGMFVVTSFVLGQGRGNSPFSETGGRFITESKEFENDATFTVPNGVTRLMVEVWGAGGGGAAAGMVPMSPSPGAPANFLMSGRGGGGGAYSRFFLDVAAGQNVGIHIGQGGSGGTTANTTGGDGGDSWVNFGAAPLTAAGGKGGFLAFPLPGSLTGGAGGSRNTAAAISRAGFAGGWSLPGQWEGGAGGQAAPGGTVSALSGFGGKGGDTSPPPTMAAGTAGSNGYVLLSW